MGKATLESKNPVGWYERTSFSSAVIPGIRVVVVEEQWAEKWSLDEDVAIIAVAPASEFSNIISRP